MIPLILSGQADLTDLADLVTLGDFADLVTLGNLADFVILIDLVNLVCIADIGITDLVLEREETADLEPEISVMQEIDPLDVHSIEFHLVFQGKKTIVYLHSYPVH